jgi:hypothetical protein
MLYIQNPIPEVIPTEKCYRLTDLSLQGYRAVNVCSTEWCHMHTLNWRFCVSPTQPYDSGHIQ